MDAWSYAATIDQTLLRSRTPNAIAVTGSSTAPILGAKRLPGVDNCSLTSVHFAHGEQQLLAKLGASHCFF